ncbi:dipeptidase [Rhodocaloribacter litoris]|uniref:dipeptidase n=1 Tax=Rhodocaloribacter litoris TaxID=2558931 RepID=UPI00141FAF6D|nr:dipeptidase [Rhodocaloribacter litoris]QXD16361.1 dipeptidase [Rhodocaloribacter litoris]
MRPLFFCLILSMLVLPACDRGEEALVETARAIHERVLTIDTHADIPFNFATEEVDPLDADRQVNLQKMQEGGLDAAFFIVYVGQTERTPENYEKAKADALVKFDAIHRMTEELYPDLIELAYTADDVERIHRAGKLVAAIGIENGYVIGKDLALLKQYHDLGARYMTLAHNGHNDIADSAQPQPELGDVEAEHDGLSPFGEEVVREMNRLGIMVDVSHISKAAMLDAVRVSRAPVIASHSSVRALADHPRNMDDEQLRALKENGGVIQIVALEAFVKADPPEKEAAVAALREEMGITGYAAWQALSDSARAVYRARMDEIDARWPGPDVRDFVDHIDYAVELIGIDHVGIASDFDGGGGLEGWQDASETFNVTLELVRRGYTEAQIAQLWGGNLLRVWREVERVAREMQAEVASR